MSSFPRPLHSAALFILGMAPLTVLALSLADVAPLAQTGPQTALAFALLIPAIATAHPLLARRSLHGLLAGVLATAVYDTWRLGCLGLGLLDGDPIPGIGAAMGLEPAWAWGYAWRFLGDGGGLGIAYAALGLRGARSGVGYGLAVVGCLFVLLAGFETAQTRFFSLDAQTAGIVLVGHLIYGFVLGTVIARWSPGGGEVVEADDRLVPLDKGLGGVGQA